MKKISLVLILAVMAGCAGTTSLRNTLEDKKGPLVYVHDSEKNVDKKAGSLTISNFAVADVLSADTNVVRESSSFLPLLVFNTWKQECQARLGYSQIENDYKQFFHDSLIDEVKRSCIYSLQDAKGDIAVEVNIKAIDMSAPIRQRGNFIFAVIFFAWGHWTSAGPVDVSVHADVQVHKGDAVMFTKEMTGHYRTNILEGKNVNLADYTTAMIEGVSMAIKNLNETIVNEINKI